MQLVMSQSDIVTCLFNMHQSCFKKSENLCFKSVLSLGRVEFQVAENIPCEYRSSMKVEEDCFYRENKEEQKCLCQQITFERTAKPTTAHQSKCYMSGSTMDICFPSVRHALTILNSILYIFFQGKQRNRMALR